MSDNNQQIEMLVSINEKLKEDQNVFNMITANFGDLYVYYDLRKGLNIRMYGPWDDITDRSALNSPFDKEYLRNFIYDEDWDYFNNNFLQMEKNKQKHSEGEVRIAEKKGWFRCNGTVNYDGFGNPVEKLLAFTNITRIKAQHEELQYLAYYDSLTGLYNRNHFVSLLRNMCEDADKNKTSVELLFLDIDDFKKINDSIGLLLGDELVQAFAGLIREYSNENIKIGRFGSDVFSIAIFDPLKTIRADEIYKGICEKLKTPFVLTNKKEVRITVSGGVAGYPEGGRTAFELVKNVEIVLFKAKESGKNNLKYFELDMINSFIKSVSIEERLKEAIENEDFELYFQPQFYAVDNKLRGAEALIRWIDENGEVSMYPTDFIPIAEKNGAIIPIGNWVIKDSMRIVSEWCNEYDFPFILSINISAVQLAKDNFVDDLRHALNLYGVNAEYIELELTESIFLEDSEKAIRRINQLRKLGFRISLDDFGTGFSSLSYLKNLPIDTLKIDKSFVDTAIKDKATNIITESLVDMVNKLGLETIAEGVEEQDQYDYLKKIKCDVIQGYLFGKPMSKSEFEKLFIGQLSE
ncbi:MAG: bifunctional diguanylate cyclase/phosphodiesterase [Lachnospiraceae bacterium]|nr:bifunctional diguanylate cyclase/phosphodiesterase [Lachnospiraceae bacterium]